MSATRACIRRPIAVAMFYLAVALLGIISFARLPIALLPDVAYPTVVIYTAYPDVGPAEVERLITERVEDQVARLPGVHEVTSVSREGASAVTVRFVWGADMDFAVLNVRERLQTLSLPERADRPVVLRSDPGSQPLIGVSVTGLTDPRALRELTGTVFRRRLEQIDGVAQVAVTGGLEREIHVEVDVRRLEAHGIAMDDVAMALEAANHRVPGGTVQRQGFLYHLRTMGHLESVRAIEDVVVVRRHRKGGAVGAVVRVRDVASVRDGFRDRRSITRYNGEESVGLLLFTEPDANAVRVGREVRQVLDELRAEHGAVRLHIATNQADFVEDALASVGAALAVGAVLAFLVLFVFLRDPRYPIAVAVAIPVSVVATFLLLDVAGISLNIMSLGGLALGVGMLVDNSIVVLESISRQRELQRLAGVSPARAAVMGTAMGAEEVKGAIAASTLTTIAVFGPILYVEGVAGALFGALSLTVAFSLLTSLLVALTLLPTMASRWEDRRSPSPSGPFARAYDRLAGWHQRVLVAALRNRRRVALLTLLLVVAAAVVGASLDRGLLPAVDDGGFRVHLALAPGTPLTETADAAARIEGVLLAEPGVVAAFSRVGEEEGLAPARSDRVGPHTAAIDVLLDEGSRVMDVVAAVRGRLEAIQPGRISIATGQSNPLGRVLGAYEAAVVVRVVGEDLAEALTYAGSLERALGRVSALTDVRVDVEPGRPEVRIDVDGERAASFDMDPRRISDTVDRFMLGTEATQLVAFDRRTPVVVRLSEQDRRSPDLLHDLQVDGFPLRALAATEEARGPGAIQRRDRGRIVPVVAGVARADLAAAVADARSAIAQHAAPPGVRAEVGGVNEEMQRSFDDLRRAFVVAVLLVYMILAAQLASFVHPLTVLLSVPMALVGAVAALRITGEGLNTMSLIGFVILTGVVVNDAILKVDFIQRARARGAALDDAILEAGAARLKPILMTTVTTVLGLAPMALSLGRGADLRAPLAIVVIGGLVAASTFTLVVIPVAYHGLESARAWTARRVGSL